MNIKTLTGSSIQEALAEARRLFGEDVVLLESVPSQNGLPARITIMAEAPTRRAVPSRPAASPPSGDGNAHRAQRNTLFTINPVVERNAGTGASLPGGRLHAEPSTPGAAGEAAAPPAAPRRRERTVGRDRLFSSSGQPSDRTNPSASPAAAAELEKLLDAQLRVLHERLEVIERRFGEAIIGASQQWVAHPLYTRLLRCGLQPATATKLFGALAERGHQPDDDREELSWVLAQELRTLLDVAAPKRTTGTQVFVGPSGAGKTSLLLKLATHPSFYARRKTTIVAILPEDGAGIPHQSPVDLFRRYGISTQSVRNMDEMAHALDRTQHFDQILVDTPPLPCGAGEAHRAMLRIKRIVEPIMPLQVHLVLNATRALDDFDVDLLNELPLRPDMAALTHLDDSRSWGRIAEWLMAIRLPVPFVSVSPRVTDGAVAFSTAWFVEEMMDL